MTGPSDNSNNSSANKPGSPKSIRPNAGIPKSGKDVSSMAQDAGKQAAVNAAARAADSVVPGSSVVVKKLAKTEAGQKVLSGGVKAAKTYLKLWIALPIVMIVVIVSIVSGPLTFDSANMSVPYSEEFNIPPNYLEAYTNSADEYDVPWTLIAAVGYNATDHGRTNPYGRAPTSATNLYVLGDAPALPDNTGQYIKEKYPDYTNVSATGMTLKKALKTLKDNPPSTSDIVLVDYSTQGKRYGSDLAKILDAIGADKSVYWLTIPGRDAYENLAIRSAQNLNLTVIDWSEQVGSDILLLENYKARAEYILEGIGLDEKLDPIASSESSCPSASIQPKKPSLTKGYGPLLLKPSYVSQYVSESDSVEKLQNICYASDIVAQALAEEAELVADAQGLAYPQELNSLTLAASQGDADAAKLVDTFWSDVASSAEVLGDINEDICDVLPQGKYTKVDWVPLAVHDYWTCELRATGYLGYTTNVQVDSNTNIITYEEDDDAVEQIAQEALDVSWLTPNGYLENGQPSPSRWDDSQCDNAAEYAGIFPLTKLQFTEGLTLLKSKNKSRGKQTPQGDNRCVPDLNIAVAAALFIKGESVKPELRPSVNSPSKYEKLAGGWARIGDVFTPTADYNTFGPWSTHTYVCDSAKAVLTTMAQQGSPVTDDVLTQILNNSIEATNVDATLRVKVDELVAQVKVNCPVAFDRDPELHAYIGKFTNDAPQGVLADAQQKYYVALGLTALSMAAATDVYYSNSLVTRLSNSMPIQVRYDGLPAKDLSDSQYMGNLLVSIAKGMYKGLFIGGESVIGSLGEVGSEVEYYKEFNAVGVDKGVDPRLLAAIAESGSKYDAESNCDLPSPSESTRYGLMHLVDSTTCGKTPRAQIEAAADLLLQYYKSVSDWRGALFLYYNGPTFAQAWLTSKGNLNTLRTLVENKYKADNAAGDAAVALSYIDDKNDGSPYYIWSKNIVLYASAQDLINVDSIINLCPSDYAPTQIPGEGLLNPPQPDEGNFLRSLCIDSINQAVSMQAASAIVFVFNNLGVKYDQTTRGTVTFDCSSYVATAYMYAGVPMGSIQNPYSTYNLLPRDNNQPLSFIEEISLTERKPGDLYFPIEGHVVMILANGYIASAPNDGKVTNIRKFSTQPGTSQLNRVYGDKVPSTKYNVTLKRRGGQ